MNKFENDFTSKESMQENVNDFILFNPKELESLQNRPKENKTNLQQFAHNLEFRMPDPPTEEEDAEDYEKERGILVDYISNKQEELGLNDHEVKLGLVTKMVEKIGHAQIDDFIWLSREFDINPNSIPTEVLEPALEKGVALAVNFRSDFEDYDKIAQLFPNQQDIIHRGIVQGYKETIERGWYDYMTRIYKRFGKDHQLELPDKEQYLESLTALIKYGSSWEDVPKLVAKAEVSEAEVINILNNRIDEEFMDFSIDAFCKDSNLSNKGIEQLLHHPKLGKSLSSLESNTDFKKMPLTAQLRLTVVSCFKPERQPIIQEEIKYLAQAYEINPIMAGNLLAGLISADNGSRENIHALCNALPENYNDISGSKYRRHTQDHLTSYKNNNVILEALKKHNINTDTWLNYETESHFTLENPEQKLAILLEPQCDRLLEAIQHIKSSFVEILAEYRSELKISKLENPEVSIAQKSLDGIEAKIQTLDINSELYIKLERAKESTKQRIQNIKPIPAWNKLIGDLEAIEKPLKDLNSLIKDSVSDNTTKNSNPEVKNYIEKNILKIDEKLKAWLSLIESSTKSILGENRAIAITQEIEISCVKDLDHWETDFKDIKANLENKTFKAGSVVGRSVSISLWNRDMKDDLYLGHYTNCCIRADSTVLEGELTITDYLTDLGIQVIVVKDDKTKKPFAAAWCFIGEDENNTKFIIDNIEADTAYSGPFKKQLESELGKYIEQFANKCGLDILEQGPHNNDLKVAGYGESTTKLGGYNRPDGYYLEGERDDE